MTPRNEIKEDLENLVAVPPRQMELLIEYVRAKEKEACELEREIYFKLKRKYEL